jgi:hypothetical protein
LNNKISNPGIKNKTSRIIYDITPESVYSEDTEKQPQLISSPLMALTDKAIKNTINKDDKITVDVFIKKPEIRYSPEIISSHGSTIAKEYMKISGTRR